MRQFVILIVLFLSINFTPVFAQTNDSIDATWEGGLETVKSLIEQGADVHAVDDFLGWTALMWASFYRRTETAELLLAKGADIHATDNDGETVLMMASVGGADRNC